MHVYNVYRLYNRLPITLFKFVFYSYVLPESPGLVDTPFKVSEILTPAFIFLFFTEFGAAGNFCLICLCFF